MEAKNPFIITFMHVIFYIIFVGLAIQTGALLTTYLIRLFTGVQGTYTGQNALGLGEVYRFGFWHFNILASYIICISFFKTLIAYQVIAIFQHLDLEKPFKIKIVHKIRTMGVLALIAGGISVMGAAYDNWLMKREVNVTYDWGSNEILFFAGVIFVIGLIFKRGAELQAENELTV